MSRNVAVPVILASLLILTGMVSPALSEKDYYNGYWFYKGVVPSGMIPYDDTGWSHGSLFSAPNWLLEQIDPNLMSTVLDRGVTPVPTEVPPDYEDYVAEGYVALEAGNYRTAYDAFQKAVGIEPSSEDAWYGMGLALEGQKRYLSALDAYSEAIVQARGSASNWASYAGKGRVLYELNRFDEARLALEMAISQYEKGGISSPDELDSIYRILEEISNRSSLGGILTPSAYIPPSAYSS